MMWNDNPLAMTERKGGEGDQHHTVSAPASLAVPTRGRVAGDEVGVTYDDVGGGQGGGVVAVAPNTQPDDEAPPTSILGTPAKKSCMCLRHANTCVSIFLLSFNIFVLLFYFVIHCTPSFELAIYPGARRWIGITPTVEVIAGVLLGVGLAGTIFVLAKVRCSARGGWGGGGVVKGRG